MSEDPCSPPPVTIVWTCELNFNCPLKVWRMAMTPTRKPYLALICACMTFAARADSAFAKGGLSRKRGHRVSGIVNVIPLYISSGSAAQRSRCHCMVARYPQLEHERDLQG